MIKGGRCLFCAFLALACAAGGEPLVRVGDSTEAVRNHLGEPNLEFPVNGQLVQDYGYCVITSRDGVVVAIKAREDAEASGLQDENMGTPVPTIKGLTKKAKAGDAESQYTLAFCYHTGQVLQKNMDEAIRWYTFAALQGHVAAQHNLGCIYMKGDGVPRDYEQAYTWAVLASGNGNSELIMMLKNRVSEDQKAAAFARAERIRDGLEESPYGSPEEETAIAKVAGESATSSD